ANGNQGYYLFPTTNLKNGGWGGPPGPHPPHKNMVKPHHQRLFNKLKNPPPGLNQSNANNPRTERGGFDAHQQQNTAGGHPDLQKVIGWSLFALRQYFTHYADQVDWSKIVVVTLSEFGRTTVENSDNGTDHAEAGVMFVAGGAVHGYKPGTAAGV